MGQSALLFAAKNNQLESTNILLRAKDIFQSVNAISQLDKSFPTVIMAATINGWRFVVSALLKKITEENVSK